MSMISDEAFKRLVQQMDDKEFEILKEIVDLKAESRIKKDCSGHKYKPIKRFYWPGTDLYIVVHGCTGCGRVWCTTIDQKYVPRAQAEMDEASRVADSLLRCAHR